MSHDRLLLADDADVIQRSWDDPEQFAALFDRHAPRIHRYVARRAGREVADDLVAEARERIRAAIESSETNLFVFNPRMSYASEDWIKADPEFWKPKAGMGESKKPAAKAAEKPAGQ